MSVVELISGIGAKWAQRGLQPPSEFYVSATDVLAVVSQSSLANPQLEIRARMLRGNGNIEALRFFHTPNSDRTAKVETFVVGEGWLLGGVIIPVASNVSRGQTYVSAYLSRGEGAASVFTQPLFADYIESSHVLGFPYGQVKGSTEGSGFLHVVTGTDPAPGAQILETVPTGALWRFYSLYATYTADATVANRIPVLQFDDGATIYHATSVQSPITASQVRDVCFASYGTSPSASALVVGGPLTPELRLPAGSRIKTALAVAGPADDWNAPKMLVEEWIL